MKKTKLLTFLLCALCAVCVMGFAACEDEAHTHTYSKEWSADADGHYHAADCGHADEKADKAAHTYGEWTDGAAATCAGGGTRSRKCTVCEYEDVEITAVATEHTGTPVHVEAKAKSCTEAGNIEHWACPTCDRKYTDEDFTGELENVTVEASHTVVANPGRAKSCAVDGVEPYYECADCDAKFADAVGSVELDELTPIPASHGYISLVMGTPKSCKTAGVEDYYECQSCHAKFADEDGTEVIVQARTIAASHGAIIHTDEVPATCTEDGHDEYWSCEDCGQKYSDAAGATVITNVTVYPATGHGNHVSEVAEGADEVLTIENPTPDASPIKYEYTNYKYYVCSACGKKYNDEDCQQEITVTYSKGRAYGKRGTSYIWTSYTGYTYVVYGENKLISTTSQICFKVESAGLYSITTTSGEFSSLLYFNGTTSKSGITRNLTTSVTTLSDEETVKDYFAMNQPVITKQIFVNAEEGALLAIQISGITTPVFDLTIEKATSAYRSVYTGSTSVSVASAEENVNGAGYIFTAPADGYYSISIPASSKYIVYIGNSNEIVDGDINEKAVQAIDYSASTSYIFGASKGEKVVFYFIVDDTTSTPTFPASADVSITTATPTIINVDELSDSVTMTGGNISNIYVIHAEVAGTYTIRLTDADKSAQPKIGNGRNLYTVSVNGRQYVTNGYSVGADNDYTIEVELNEGDNTFVLSNSQPYNSTGTFYILVESVAA